MPPDFEEEAVEAEFADPAEAGVGRLNDFEIRIGVSYFTSEKLFDALVVIFVLQIKL